MKQTTSDDQSKVSHLSCCTLKLMRQSHVIIKIVLGIIIIAVVTIIGWGLHVNLVEKNKDNQSPIQTISLSPTILPTIQPTIQLTTQPTTQPTSLPHPHPTQSPIATQSISPTQSPILSTESIDYIEQFLGPTISKHTLYKHLPKWNTKISQMEIDIKRFMNQKIAIQKLFKNIACAQDAHTAHDTFNQWYSAILACKPTIDIDKKKSHSSTVKLNIDRFDHEEFCVSNNNGWIINMTIHQKHHCNGSIDLTSLSNLKELKVLHMTENGFTGTINLTSLPQSLEILILKSNQFTGSIDLTMLPQTLKNLDLSHNQFDGTVNLTSLPSELVELDLSFNKFNGIVDFSSVPRNSTRLEQLSLSMNQFSGSIDLEYLPESLQRLLLNNNQFDGSVNLTLLPKLLTDLFLNHNQFTGTVDLTSLPETLHDLLLDYNQFNGTVDRSKLPQTLWHLGLSHNLFDD